MIVLDVNFKATRRQMVDQQIRAWGVLDPRVVAVMGSMARERFVPERYRYVAYADSDIPIGHGEVMLVPKVQGRLLQALELEEGQRVLEIGTGTGYLTACLLALGAAVSSVDIHEDFVRSAAQNLEAEGFRGADIQQEDAHTLAAAGPQYDAILVTGSLPVADPSFPRRLAVGGRLVWILGQEPAMRAEVLFRLGDDEWRSRGLFETVAPALKGTAAPRRFDF
ncbi:MAG TPA: protein-L-isoaspartate O-methyltransferase [Gammaproteobacteria bacterium]|nr:protein-L-isoaspartate O-methyltransferase [Gammaproteobacteria bacterium]